MPCVLPRALPSIGVLWGWWGGPSSGAASSVASGSPEDPSTAAVPSGNGEQPCTTFWGSWDVVGDKFTLPGSAR